MLFAHSSERRDRTDWEPLKDHLLAVAARAGEYSAQFDARAWGETAGLLHDLGKAKPAFQAKLRGEANSEPHSGEGARYAEEHLPGLVGKLLAFCIAGHHSGLPNGATHSEGRPPTPLRERTRTAELIQLPEGIVLPTVVGHIPRPLSVVPANASERSFAFQFFARMIFSALVDADYIETERFYDELGGRASRRSQGPSVAVLSEALEERLSRFGNPSGTVNKLRDEIRSHVRSQAAAAPGLFSLTVPTGGGKTLASLAFALDHAKRHGLQRVIYVIPYTSIVEQTADVFRDALKDNEAVLEHHSAFDWDGLDDPAESERMKLAAQNWDRPVIVTTAVQFFESLYSNRTSKCRKLHRLANAVMILDEAQTLPLRLLRPCLAALRELARGYNSSIVLCTATQPALFREDGFPHPEGFARADVRELAPQPAQLYEALRRVRVVNCGPLSDDELLARLAAKASGLVIVNNRRHARQLFERIRDHDGASHLTTSMTPEHRRSVLREVRTRLAQDLPVHLIATSLIEAGVDVDFPVVYRAVAGIDSVAQAAGRCNREGRMAERGEVFVFRPSGEHRPPPDLKQFADIGAEILSRHADPLSLDAVRDYFRLLYWDRAHDLDAEMVGSVRGIIPAIERSGGQMDFPFADIASAFRIIADGALPIVIRGGAFGVPDATLERLQTHPHPGTIARQLQPYQIQLPQRVRGRFVAAGAAEFWREDEFGPQFLLLANVDLYDDRAGLRWDDIEDFGLQEL
ncbi:CRISPR-associated helicase Cas3' [Limibaculum sp. M0105]|uniref:CRISPR-associated helicase Cas3 n=1 Tax=Thermohalobaculum xanthum TaxID=2753746 RepID=A0A8J7M4V3_9RHOB|nr:CRISPR-associated helicase Cas3' [Thermohalobaculum xanthum]MBK0398486.1 CRISPR-associated helicase Cas3' [Thermohalobaculum xanthum]